VGVLALQGDVREHAAMLSELGAEVVEVRRPEDLEGLDGFVLPGGESTTLSLLLQSSGLFDPLAERLAAGLPVLGTCAGMILLGREVLDGRSDQRVLGVVDLSVRRNAFGRQLESFEADLDVEGLEGGPVHAVFIRAPVVERAGEDVEVLASVEMGGVKLPVVCRSGAATAVAFHPELTGEDRLHRLLLEEVASRRKGAGA
jgi:5'-phosphate synthase pdxT subunit